MSRIHDRSYLGVLYLTVGVCIGTLAFCAPEPKHEQEAASPPAQARIQLSVPEKKWLNSELYGSEPGHYGVIIWGHAETARAMPEKFDVEAEVRHLAQHHIDWYTVGTPKSPEARQKFRERFAATGIRAVIGFPRTDTVEEALKEGASPSNPSEVKQGKKAKVAPIDPHYVAASLRVVAEQYGEKENLDWVRAVHFQDEPSGEIPYYDIAAQADMPLAKSWDKQVRETFGLGEWGLPASNWDTNCPQCRLAYQKFWAREFNEYQRTMAQAIRAHHPKLPVWSANFWFNMGADLLFDYGEMGEFLDAIVVDSYATQQEINFPGRGRWNAGFVTKIVGDLAHKPVYNHIQVLEYKGATPSPVDIQEYASQVLRAGGQGLVYYAIDMPQYKYIRYTDAARWATMMDIGDQLYSLPQLKRPAKATTGVWVSQETLATTGPRVKDNDAYTAYVLLGEVIGAPFRYLSDWDVERKGASEFNDLKMIYVANAKYVPMNVRDHLTTWLKGGGVLILSRSDAFTAQIDGTTFPSWKEALRVNGKPTAHKDYDEWLVEKGRVLLLKQNVWRLGIWDNPQTIVQIRELQNQFRGGVDEPIWRFRLPSKIR